MLLVRVRSWRRRMREKFETEMGELGKSERQATQRLTELKARALLWHSLLALSSDCDTHTHFSVLLSVDVLVYFEYIDSTV